MHPRKIKNAGINRRFSYFIHMKILTILLCIFYVPVFGQAIELPKLLQQDSIAVSKAFNTFINALGNRNFETLKYVTLDEVECILCGEFDFQEEGYFVPAADFLHFALKLYSDSNLDKIIQTRGYRILPIQYHNFHPKNLPATYTDNLLLYEVWIQMRVPDEVEKGHEGSSFGFQFVKIENNIKLWGVTSVP